MSMTTDSRNSLASSNMLDLETSSRKTNTTTTAPATKVTSQESLNFGPKDLYEDDSQQEIDLESRRILTTLQLAVIFEECVDTLTALSNSLAAPVVEIRTATSIIEDEFLNRPRFAGSFRGLGRPAPRIHPSTKYTTALFEDPLPPIAQSILSHSRSASEHRFQGSKSKDEIVRDSHATGSQGSHAPARRRFSIMSLESLADGVQPEHLLKRIEETDAEHPTPGTGQEGEEGEEGECRRGERWGGSEHESRYGKRLKEKEGATEGEEWSIQQFYHSKVSKRTWQSNKDTPKRNLEEMLKSSGLRKNNPVHKVQADMACIKFMMADIFNELVQKGTWDCLLDHLEREREELKKIAVAYGRLQEKRKYSRSLRTSINHTRQEKRTELQFMKMMEHQIEDEAQEIRVRTLIETLYTANFVDAKIKKSLKMSTKSPEACEREISRIQIWLELEEDAHRAMKIYINHRIAEMEKLHEYWTEKYDMDKERLMADLDELKEERAATAAHRARLEEKIRLWSPIIKDQRRVDKVRQDRIQFVRKCEYYATKVQARWRGFMVRAGMGKFARTAN